jgi:hypothetical protein
MMASISEIRSSGMKLASRSRMFVVVQDHFYQLAVHHHPRSGALRASRRQAICQFFRDGVRIATGLPGNCDSANVLPLSISWLPIGPQLRVNETQVPFYS